MEKNILLTIAIALCSLCIPNSSDVGHDEVNIRLLYWFSLGQDLSLGTRLQDYIASMDSLDISIEPPKEFRLLAMETGKSRMVFAPDPTYCNKYGVVGFSVLGPFFESDSKDALIVYPLAIDYIGMTTDALVENELIAAHRDETLDINPLINVMENPAKTNADRLTEYEFDVADPAWSDYGHCITLALRKKNHYAFPIKLFLNNEGLKNKDRYIALALESVRYGDNPKPEWIEKEKAVDPNEGVFPTGKTSDRRSILHW